MKLKQGVSMALTLAVLCGGAAEASKEEVIYGVLDAQGNVDGLYAVNIFPGGDIVDYGDYSSVHALNTAAWRVSTAMQGACFIRAIWTAASCRGCFG